MDPTKSLAVTQENTYRIPVALAFKIPLYSK